METVLSLFFFSLLPIDSQIFFQWHHFLHPQDETRFYMAELLEALELLHMQGFIHRDIKAKQMWGRWIQLAM